MIGLAIKANKRCCGGALKKVCFSRTLVVKKQCQGSTKDDQEGNFPQGGGI